MLQKVGIIITMLGLTMADSESLIVPVLVTGIGLLITVASMKREAGE